MEVKTQDGLPDRGPAVFTVTTVTMILATVFVAARMVTRIGIVRRVAWDDYIIMLAWLLAVGLGLTINLGTTKGLGRHDADIDAADKPWLRMCEYVFSILYNPALMATKTSILVFYLRLAKNTQKLLRLGSWATLAIGNVAGTILTIMNIFQCQPISAAWDINVQTYHCIPLLTEFICSAPVNIVTDLAILALPIPVLTGMQLPPRQKTILVITFTLGIFVTVVDVVRIYYLQQAIGLDPSAVFGQSVGFPWNASLSLMWSAVEVNVVIICACIPTLKPLIIKILPAMVVDPNGTRRSSKQPLNMQHVSTSLSSKPDECDNSQIDNTVTAIDEPLSTIPQEPPSARIHESRESAEITMEDFLANTAVTHGSTVHGGTEHSRKSFLFQNGQRNSCSDNSVYFGFVNMKRPKSMLKTSTGESFKYCTIVSILFFLWGFSYGLLNTLNNVVANIANMSTAQTLGLTSVYFGAGYFFGPLLVGEWLLRHDEHHRSKRRTRGQPESVGGFKATFIVGLLIYGAGTIMFWPGAVLNSYAGFMVSSFVVGFGIAVLETSANPFLALCGPPEYADARLLLAQGVQAVGSVLSGLLANNVFFPRMESRQASSTLTLLDVQWTYLAVTLLSVLLALFFYYMPLPEVSDRELGRLARRLPVDPKKRSIGGIELRTWCIVLAVASQWMYMGAQENMSIFFSDLITVFAPPEAEGNPFRPTGFPMSVLNFLVIAHTAFAVSRFTAGGLAYLSVKYPDKRYIPTPRTMLLASATLSTFFVLIAVAMPKPADNPSLIAIPIVLYFLAEGPMWPLIFSLGLRGQGKRTKRAAAWLTVGGSGPAFWPFVSWAVMKGGGGVRTSFVVVVVLMAGSLVYPVFLSAVKDARTLVDADPGAMQAGDAERGALSWRGLGGRKGTMGAAGKGEGEGEAEVPPWERQVLDTRILQD
ncbi:major facilitator superfamily domain-containing protein [Podospora appendiculata]|uniref:Major facilitator superfamily domain-containing protein n=1 Tax=Podospora appendiculata TaxID=314037 RepID=A0AAE0WZR7_9PEZI|nr:major facilitator superfamily domain-containing protein [Podospora appendiculata]